MINLLWMAILAVGVVFSMTQGPTAAQALSQSMMEGANDAVKFGIGLIGVLAFWSGIMKIIEEAGIAKALSRLLAPVVRRLFPSVPADHPANASILMSVVANMVGIGHAATPLGIKAMQDLQALNPNPREATDAMCTFVVMCTSSLTLIPATVIAMRAAAGSVDPTSIVATTLIATTMSTMAALFFDRIFRMIYHGMGRRRQ